MLLRSKRRQASVTEAVEAVCEMSRRVTFIANLLSRLESPGVVISFFFFRRSFDRPSLLVPRSVDEHTRNLIGDRYTQYLVSSVCAKVCRMDNLTGTSMVIAYQAC